ncbi:MAG TPA: hemerythrin domain-containing protein [Cryomorphaceae bacterium]|nr:hemerythrin domain-containing protein [Cryomorphaceae bacterium]
MTKQGKPIKRHESLKPLSRQHHHGLLLSWKIRRGFAKDVDPKRIKRYADWFYVNHLIPHFHVEEKYLFPVLGDHHEMVKKAVSEHRRLGRLFADKTDIVKSLSLIEEELEKHIRFEERILFAEIQLMCTEEHYRKLEKVHEGDEFTDNLDDVFWE